MGAKYGRAPSSWLLPDRTPEMNARRADALRLLALDLDLVCFQLGLNAEAEARNQGDDTAALARQLAEMG